VPPYRRDTMNSASRQKQQESFERQYAAAKNHILQVGYVTEGSLSKRYLTCGNSSCRCTSDPTHRHGPYYQLTWKRNGRTVSQVITEPLAHEYEEWIRNRQSLSKILKQLHAISKKAIYSYLGSITEPVEKSVISSVKKKLRKT
jgi:hypothetical protein